MSWRGRGSCAVAVLLAGLAGCAVDSINARFEQTRTSGDTTVIAGSADEAAGRAQLMLQGLGVSAEVRHERDEVRLACATASGKRFFLHLTETPTKTGAETRLRLEWESGPDDPLAARILAGLEALNVAQNK